MNHPDKGTPCPDSVPAPQDWRECFDHYDGGPGYTSEQLVARWREHVLAPFFHGDPFSPGFWVRGISMLEGAELNLRSFVDLLAECGWEIHGQEVRQTWRERCVGRWIPFSECYGNDETEHLVRIEDGVLLEIRPSDHYEGSDDCAYLVEIDDDWVATLGTEEEAKRYALEYVARANVGAA